MNSIKRQIESVWLFQFMKWIDEFLIKNRYPNEKQKGEVMNF